MSDLLFALLELIGPMLPIRLTAVISGLIAVGCGLLIVAGRARGPFLVLGVLLVAGGVGLVVAGVALRVPEPKASEQGTPPPDDWRPPDGEDVKKMIKGRR